MDKIHDVQKISFTGTTMKLHIDGKKYEIELGQYSKRLVDATPEQREKFVVSPSGYGIHWPDIDEDLSIDGLIGVAHFYPALKAVA
ncbi:MAG: DUF2442 domain-containing protein [Desulfobulbaceae bacterium]|nr:DUF2442 domain-containing protein [Desulfobulbaceae bacterium]